MPPRISLIINPTAGRGAGRADLAGIEALFCSAAEASVAYTGARGDEAVLTERAIASGATTIVAVGGDGTCSRVADAIVRGNRPCTLAVVPRGTGNDFAKTIGVAKYSPAAIAHLVLNTEPTRIDVGIADGHHFLNSCGFGFDAAVLEASNSVRFLKGDAVYIYSALRQLFSYRGIDISSREAGPAAWSLSGRMLMATVSNGKSLGGAFQIAPDASVTDGKLDACFIANTRAINRMRLFAAALRGRHLGMPGVTARAVTGLNLSFEASPAMEMDGELRTARGRTVELSCLPRALAVVAAPGALS